jgi:hypothetical protein
MTGRAAGFCSGVNAPGFTNRLGRRFLGRSGGFRGAGSNFWNSLGRMCRNGWMGSDFWQAPDSLLEPEAEKVGLKQEAKVLQNQLKMIQKRIEELEPPNTD